MSINLLKLINPLYLIDLRPTISTAAAIFFFVFFSLFLIAAIITKTYQQKIARTGFMQRLFKKYFNLFLTVALIGYFWTLMRLGEVQLFSARIWFLLLILFFIVRLVLIIRYQKTSGQKAKEQSDRQEMFNKYLPKKRK